MIKLHEQQLINFPYVRTYTHNNNLFDCYCYESVNLRKTITIFIS